MADLHWGARDVSPPWPKFLYFHVVFGENWPNSVLAPPPLGNSGSAIVWCWEEELVGLGMGKIWGWEEESSWIRRVEQGWSGSTTHLVGRGQVPPQYPDKHL